MTASSSVPSRASVVAIIQGEEGCFQPSAAEDVWIRAKAWEQAGNKIDFDPAAQVLSKLGEATICAAIEALPAEFRVVVMLADVEELSYEEIAAEAQIPVGTVKSRLYRGRRQVQKLLWVYLQEGQTACATSPSRSNCWPASG
jgi:RNA polymerase sigma factor (sigma-70 family)